MRCVIEGVEADGCKPARDADDTGTRPVPMEEPKAKGIARGAPPAPKWPKLLDGCKPSSSAASAARGEASAGGGGGGGGSSSTPISLSCSHASSVVGCAEA